MKLIYACSLSLCVSVVTSMMLVIIIIIVLATHTTTIVTSWMSEVLDQTSQLLELVPVRKPVLLGALQRFGRIAVLVEVLAETPLASAKVDEVNLLFEFWVDPPVVLQ